MRGKYLSTFVILFFLMGIVAISGCTSNSVNPQSDIIVDGNLAGQWNNQGQTEWLVNGNLKSQSNTPYSQVTLKLTAYNSQNQVVGEKTTTTTMNNGYGSISDIIPVTGNPSYVNMTVLNAATNTASDVDKTKTKKRK
ncbi:MAG: hypothetical protein ACXVHS_07300 [Methanobacterium sp.]